jgi:hypothetical protein
MDTDTYLNIFLTRPSPHAVQKMCQSNVSNAKAILCWCSEGSRPRPKAPKHKPHNQASLPGRRRAAPILICVLSVATPSDATPSSPLPVALLIPPLPPLPVAPLTPPLPPLPIAHTAGRASSPNTPHRRPRLLRSSRSSPPALDPSNLLIHSISLPPRPDEGTREGVGGVRAASHPPIRLGQPATVQAAAAAAAELRAGSERPLEVCRSSS